MNRLLRIVLVVSLALLPALAIAQATNPLWHEAKIRNYLPHMTSPEVKDLLTRTDMVIIPIASIEQHANHLPIGTDFINGVERAKLVAQRTDVLVAPILLPGSSPYHMEFAGTITLPAETIQRVYFEACQSLLAHGVRRFLLLNSHGGNQAITRYLVDRINQETAGIAVDLGEAASPFMSRGAREVTESQAPAAASAPVFDRHGGVGETADGLYLFPSLVDLSKAQTPTLTMPEHLEKMVPDVLAGDRTATLVFLAEGLKAKQTGKGTSAAEMSTTGQWGLRDPREATAEQGRRSTERFVEAAVQFIERWKALRPMGPAGASAAVPASGAPAASSTGAAQPAGSAGGARQVIRPGKFPATGLPYSPGILVDGTLYLSGQLGRDPATATLVPGGIEAETRQAITNLREVLRAAGMDLADVVSVTAFITSFDDFPAFNKVYREFFATDPPARATVQVAGLNLGATIEIQMIAARPGRRW